MNSSGFSTVNPSTGEQIETFSYFSSAETETALSRADRSFQSFRKLSLYRRAQLLSELSETLRKNKARLAKVITTEMGKIISEAEAEIEKCAHEVDWYAENAENGPQMLADEPASTGGVEAFKPVLYGINWNNSAARSRFPSGRFLGARVFSSSSG
jgi:acyl-CoA reductase-like NAD-dependent aldehyde dehydrogenase